MAAEARRRLNPRRWQREGGATPEQQSGRGKAAAPRAAQSARRQREGGATLSTAVEHAAAEVEGRATPENRAGRASPEDRAAWRQGRGQRRGEENEEKEEVNRPNRRPKDLWSRFQPRTGTKDPLVAVGNTNRDQ